MVVVSDEAAMEMGDSARMSRGGDRVEKAQ